MTWNSGILNLNDQSKLNEHSKRENSTVWRNIEIFQKQWYNKTLSKMVDYYEMLEVPKTANSDDIKKA